MESYDKNKANNLCKISLLLTYILPLIIFLIIVLIARNMPLYNDYSKNYAVKSIIWYILSRIFFISIIVGYVLAFITKKQYKDSKFARILFLIDTIIILLIVFSWVTLYIGMSSWEF